MCGNYSFLGGGFGNCTLGNRAFTGSGFYNTSSGYYAVVVGGQSNVASGRQAFIGAGGQNSVSGCYSGVPSGRLNTVSGCYALGVGSGNCVTADFSAAVGCGLTASAACTFYVNNMCVCGTLSKSSGSFKIPHPDPIKAEQGKFLKHSFVESPTSGDNIYRFNVTATNCAASVELPDYYKLMNGNDQVYVNAKKHLGYGFGVVNEAQTIIDITTNSDGEYNVLLIGTRKDKLALDAWNGTEVNDVE
jgi:hypothetical protein